MKFEDPSFLVEAEQKPGCRLVVKVTVKPDCVKKCYKQGIKKVNKQISIPGFRKGKAPDATVISKYSSYIDSEWKELVLHEAINGGCRLTRKFPLGKESLEKPKLESCSQEEGAVVTFEFEHYPSVPEIDFSKIELPKLEKEPVSQEKIDEIIEQIRKSHADFEDVEGRAIKENDYVDLSIDSLEQDPPTSIVKDRRFPVEKGVMGTWMRKLLIGKKVGDVVEGTSEAENDEKDFRPTKVRIEIHAIKKIVLPEVNDELATKVGTKSKDDLYEKIRENLDEAAAGELREKQIEALDEALLKAFPFDLPQSVVEGEKRHRISERIRSLKKQQLSDEEIQAQEAAIEKEVAETVEDSLRLYFLNKQIEYQGKIELSNQELNDELVRQVATNPAYRVQEMDKEMSQRLISNLSASLMQKKTKDYALSQVL